MKEDIISTPTNNKINLISHSVPITTSDKVAYFLLKYYAFLQICSLARDMVIEP